MRETRNKKFKSPGDFECSKLKDFINMRKRKLKISGKKTIKIEDLLLSLIYMAMYFLGLLLFIAICKESVSHTDYDPPEYLPLNLSCEHLFLEAVQRSRFKPKKINNSKKKFPSNIKYKKLKRYTCSTFDDGKFNYTLYITIYRG